MQDSSEESEHVFVERVRPTIDELDGGTEDAGGRIPRAGHRWRVRGPV